MATKKRMNFSPSLYHQRLLKTIKQSMAYDGGDVKAWQRKLRRKVKELLGLPANEGKPLRTRSLWKREHELGTIEKIVFASEPGADVPAFVCLPRDVKPPYAWAICLQGHSTGMHNSIAVDREDNRKSIEVGGDRDFGLECMRRGVAALCIEQRSFGERRELVQEQRSKAMCQEATMHALFMGRTLIGERVFDVDRGIDYLMTRDDVNPKRIGVTGNSGGGTATLFSAVMLPRIRFAMPSGYFCTFRDSIMSICHCECNYVPGLYPVAEMADVMGLFAPKPLVLVNGVEDPIFPIGPARNAFRDLKRIYKAADAARRCHHVIGDGGHRFYADDAWPVMLKEIETL